MGINTQRIRTEQRPTPRTTHSRQKEPGSGKCQGHLLLQSSWHCHCEDVIRISPPSNFATNYSCWGIFTMYRYILGYKYIKEQECSISRTHLIHEGGYWRGGKKKKRTRIGDRMGLLGHHCQDCKTAQLPWKTVRWFFNRSKVKWLQSSPTLDMPNWQWGFGWTSSVMLW